MTYHLFSDTVRRAAKQHRCIWCGQAINKGDSYHDERSVYDGSIQRNRWHPECLDYARDDMRESGDQEFMPWSQDRPETKVVAGNPGMPPCRVCGGVASRQWRDGAFCGAHDTFFRK